MTAKLHRPTKEGFKNFIEHPIAQIFVLAAALQLIVDCFSRESFFAAFAFTFTHPLVFLYNMLLIACTLVPALFFARRFFVYIVVSALWIIFGVADFILLQFRTTPFTFIDITMIQTAAKIWDHYLSVFQLVLIGLLLIGVVIGCVFIFRKTRKLEKLSFFKVCRIALLMVAGAIVATNLGVRFGVIAENFGNLANAYHDYGFPYCFISSVIDTGISKPKKYSDEYVKQIMNALENGELIMSEQAGSNNVSVDSNNPNHPSSSEQMNINPSTDGSNSSDSSSSGNVTGDSTSNGTSGETGNNPSDETENENSGQPDSETGSTENPTDKTQESAGTSSDPTDHPAEHSATPNIIFVQLESFFDPTTILGSTFTEDPLPNYHRLMREFSSGNLIVPSIGAGTANTEFEMITGMNLDFFGPGEYPYKTILKETTSESAAYVLKDLGYGTHAIHNNDGTFYGRHIVFSNLGFDTFTSVEYMKNVARTPLNWAKDEILIGEIAKALTCTDTPDYVYAISVQGHGSYPTEPIYSSPKIDLTLPEEFSESEYYQLLYYTNQIHEMDQFVGDLTDWLSSFEEDTVLVLYGDHLPGIRMSEEQVAGGNLFATPYIVWSNFELAPEQGLDIEAYQMYSYVLERLGIDHGILNRFHQTQRASDLYLEDLEILEYDMLYGDRTVYGDAEPYQPTDMQMGIDPISINRIRAFEGSLQSDSDDEVYTVFLYGSGFTEYSYVLVNEEPVSTMFVNDSILSAVMPLPEINTMITVAQIGPDEHILSETPPLTITEEMLATLFPNSNPSLDAED